MNGDGNFHYQICMFVCFLPSVDLPSMTASVDDHVVWVTPFTSAHCPATTLLGSHPDAVGATHSGDVGSEFLFTFYE